VKYIGAAYLIYLGIKSWRDKGSFSFEADTRQMNWSSIFIQGMMSNLFNPKIALFFLAFLPQFVSPELGNFSTQMVVLGVTFALCGVLFLMFVGYFSGVIGFWIAGKQLLARSIRWVTGSILVGLGLRLVFIERI
jgi:threonine/homoserine/homoserine lactone efflux protein